MTTNRIKAAQKKYLMIKNATNRDIVMEYFGSLSEGMTTKEAWAKIKQRHGIKSRTTIYNWIRKYSGDRA